MASSYINTPTAFYSFGTGIMSCMLSYDSGSRDDVLQVRVESILQLNIKDILLVIRTTLGTND